MNQPGTSSDGRRSIWLRGLFMLLMGVAFHICATILFVAALLQFFMQLLSDAPNARLAHFGRNLGSYMRQIVHFLTFATEETPFPFSEWPSGD